MDAEVAVGPPQVPVRVGHDELAVAGLGRSCHLPAAAALGDVTETADGLHIRPRPLHGGVFHTYDDHRMATAGAIIGLAVEGVRIENVATTAKTLPDFPELWAGMLGKN